MALEWTFVKSSHIPTPQQTRPCQEPDGWARWYERVHGSHRQKRGEEQTKGVRVILRVHKGQVSATHCHLDRRRERAVWVAAWWKGSHHNGTVEIA